MEIYVSTLKFPLHLFDKVFTGFPADIANNIVLYIAENPGSVVCNVYLCATSHAGSIEVSGLSPLKYTQAVPLLPISAPVTFAFGAHLYA